MNLQEMCNQELINLGEELLLENRELRKKLDGFEKAEKVRKQIEDQEVVLPYPKNIFGQGGIVNDVSKSMCGENKDELFKKISEKMRKQPLKIISSEEALKGVEPFNIKNLNVYVVERKDEVDYDEYDEETIVAENEEKALELASKETGYWIIKDKVDLTKEQILTKSFNAG